MKITLLCMAVIGTVGGSLSFASIFMAKLPTEPDAILELQNASLTTYQPTGATPIQDVRPQAGQRAVNIDGSLRFGDAFGMACAGNPFASNCPTSRQMGFIDLATGNYTSGDVDLDLPASGFHWRIMRTYSNVQTSSGGGHRDSNGYQGRNWFQSSQPELVFCDGDGIDEITDYIYLVVGADRFIEFKRVADNSDVFRATDGAAGVILHVKDASSEPDVYKYTDQVGCQFWFFGDDGDAGSAKGQLWKILDTAGETASSSPAANISFVGDATTASSAISNGYASGRILKAYDAANRRFTYNYDGTTGRLAQVVAQTKDASSSWSSPSGVTTVGQVDYTYYDGSTDKGGVGDLEFVKITVPQTDSGINLVKRKYYRYWKGDATAFNASTNPGFDYHIKMMVGFEGCRNYDYSTDGDIDDADLRSATDTALKPYAEVWCEYDSSHRVSKHWVDGACNLSGGTGNGELDLTFETNGSYSDNVGYDEDVWKTRTLVKRPDGSYATTYFDETLQPTHFIITDINPANSNPSPRVWATYVDRNSKGVIVEVSTSANVTGYTHSTGSFTRSSSVGLIYTYALVGSGSTVEGYTSDAMSKTGTSGTTYFDESKTYTYAIATMSSGVSKSTVVRPLVASDRFYAQPVATGFMGSSAWSFANTMHSSAAGERLELALKEIDTTQPAVSTVNNGSGTANSTKLYFNPIGTLAFEKSALGYIAYHEYTNGQATKSVDDADTSSLGVTVPTGFSSSTGALNHVATSTFDAQGRIATHTEDTYTPVAYYTVLKDGRQVVLNFTHSTTGPTTYYGPVGYTVRNHAGVTAVSGLITLNGNSSTSSLVNFMDESDADPITAIDGGALARLRINMFSGDGRQLWESRVYFSIPSSGAGSAGTNYDSESFGYDDSGRCRRTKEASGTIRRTTYDVIGRPSATWIGTNDSSFPGGSSGTDNMVKTYEVVYDSGNDKGNGLITQRTSYTQSGSTGQRVTNITNDDRGNPIVIASPVAPYVVHKYDHRNRLVATGFYSSPSGLNATTDPMSTTSNRVALEEANFDELGRIWSSAHHEINQGTGADMDALAAKWWFDPDGRMVKYKGSELVKQMYDRRGRLIDTCILARTDDTTYADAANLVGDIVLEEGETAYDSATGDVVLGVLVQRNHDDVGSNATTGRLDTNADGDAYKVTAQDLRGRAQINAYWSGLLGVTDAVAYGTNGGATFDRSGLSIPARSGSAHRTSYTYNTDGTVDTIQDPTFDPTVTDNRYTKEFYDQCGRNTSEVVHYDPSQNGGSPFTDSSGVPWNVTTRWGYTNGLLTSVIRDLPGSNDEVTTYAYGTSNSNGVGNSQIASGHLLRSITTPDSTSSTDVYLFAYNAQEEATWMKEPEPSGSFGSVIETDYDDGGRPIQARVTTVGTGIDDYVRRIATTYNSRGLMELVTQYSDPTVGSGIIRNEDKFDYDEWGNVSVFHQDPNSAVGGLNSVDDYRTTRTYVKAAGAGRNTLRITESALSVGTGAAYKDFTYTYSNVDKFDGDVSRITKVKDGSLTLSRYDYLGRDFIVGDTRPVPNVYSVQYSLSQSGTYSCLDAFNRTIHDRWTKGLSTPLDFASVDLSWDEKSNLITEQDKIHTGFDVLYQRDKLDRISEGRKGTLSSGSIANPNRVQKWTLSHTGNWDKEKLDLNGDENFSDSGERNDSRDYDLANKLTHRDLDSNASTIGDNITLTWDNGRNLTSDGEHYVFVSDVFHRVRFVKTLAGVVVKEMVYDGLDNLIGEHYDNNGAANDGTPDGSVDSSDVWFMRASDTDGGNVAVFRGSDPSPKVVWAKQSAVDGGSSNLGISDSYRDYCDKQAFLKMQADMDAAKAAEEERKRREQEKRDREDFEWVMRQKGYKKADWQSPNGNGIYCDVWFPPGVPIPPLPPKQGVSSYLCAYEDTESAWTAPASGNLGNVDYLLQNSRGNVCCMVTSIGGMIGWNYYSASGTIIGVPGGDVNSDGKCDATDVAAIEGMIGVGYDVRGDMDLNGVINGSDASDASHDERGGGEDKGGGGSGGDGGSGGTPLPPAAAEGRGIAWLGMTRSAALPETTWMAPGGLMVAPKLGPASNKAFLAWARGTTRGESCEERIHKAIDATPVGSGNVAIDTIVRGTPHTATRAAFKVPDAGRAWKRTVLHPKEAGRGLVAWARSLWGATKRELAGRATTSDEKLVSGFCDDYNDFVGTALLVLPMVTVGKAAAAAEGGTGAFLDGSVGGSGLGRIGQMTLRVSNRGLETVESHLARFGSVPENMAMVERLRQALATKSAISGADAIFYTHELNEATLMNRGLTYEVAHPAALEKYGVSPFSVYAPEVIDANPSNFSNGFREFWRLRR